MTCETTRTRLLEASPDELLDDPHLVGCADCRALAHALVARHADLERALTRQPAMPLTLGLPTPANTPWRWTMSSIALAAAVAATLAVGTQTAWRPDPAAGGAVPSVDVRPCEADMQALEPAALVGRLTPEDVRCLEDVFEADPSSVANRMLLVHHFSAGEIERWEERALLQVQAEKAAGRVDPDLAFKMALYFAKSSEYPLVVEHADLALAGADVWAGDTLASRLFTLHKLRAVSHEALWMQASERGIAPEPARRAAENAALDWLRVAREHGRDTDKALAICRAAARDPSVCGG